MRRRREREIVLLSAVAIPGGKTKESVMSKKLNTKKGQMLVEYAVMFVAIVAVIIYAALNVIQPSVNKLLNTSAKIIDCSTSTIANQYQ